ncbi:hypothetical protein NPIL_163371 [Nephila pilipes]|uniref:Uncharacterized protein n=1 Tax=Nephila pilipes TaxID=299642 RepID=A0A8X6PBA6_NEPPI|nr:hypothetical protein NPIL_163371 [Nephila pilipes]
MCVLTVKLLNISLHINKILFSSSLSSKSGTSNKNSLKSDKDIEPTKISISNESFVAVMQCDSAGSSVS